MNFLHPRYELQGLELSVLDTMRKEVGAVRVTFYFLSKDTFLRIIFISLNFVTAIGQVLKNSN